MALQLFVPIYVPRTDDYARRRILFAAASSDQGGLT